MGVVGSVTDLLAATDGRPPDVIVAGGGLVGLELASELRHRGADRVLVVEAGPGDVGGHVNHRMAPDDATTICFDHQRDPAFMQPWRSRSGPHYTRNSGLRRILGGRSLYWYGAALPLDDWALRAPWWPDEIVADLTVAWRGGACLYDRISERLTEWSGDPSMFPGRQPGPVVDGYQLSSLPRAVRRDGARWSAYSALDGWRGGDGRLHIPDGIDVCCNTEVLDVIVRRGRASGVLVRERSDSIPRELTGGRVVVCAATIESSRLVLQARAAAGSAPQWLGGLADHIVQGFVLRIPEPDAARADDFPTGAFSTSSSAAMRSYLRIDVHRPPSGEVVFEARHTGEQMPSEHSRITCSPAPGPQWPVMVDCRLAMADLEVVAAQRDDLCSFWAGLAVRLGLEPRKLIFEPYGEQTRTNTIVLPSKVSTLPPSRAVTWASYLGTEDHEAGTVPLGTVLDTRHELDGVPGLHVCGPAVHPRSGSANPAMTALALTHRLAAVLTD